MHDVTFGVPSAPIDDQSSRPALAWADMVLANYSKTQAESRAHQAAFAVARPCGVQRAMTHGGFMGDEHEDLAYLLGKAEDYCRKAKAVSEPGLKAALEAVARQYMLKARELDPTLPEMAEIKPSSEVQ